jgi:hypothetical protein
MFAATSLNTWNVVTDYLSYPVVTSTTEALGSSVEFPTVTICNNSPVSCMKLFRVHLHYRQDRNVYSLLMTSMCPFNIGKQPLIGRLVIVILLMQVDNNKPAMFLH